MKYSTDRSTPISSTVAASPRSMSCQFCNLITLMVMVRAIVIGERVIDAFVQKDRKKDCLLRLFNLKALFGYFCTVDWT